MRILKPEDSESICQLFEADGATPSPPDFWQDRSPNFFALYDHIRTQPPTFMGFYERGALIASNGLVPVKYTGLENFHTKLDVDLMVHPKYRKSTAMGRLVKSHIEYGLEHESYHSIYLAVEHAPGLMQKISLLTRRAQFEMMYLGPTTLSMSLLDPQFSWSHGSIETIPTCDATEKHIHDFLKGYQSTQNNQWLSPIIDQQRLNKLIQIDHKSCFILERKNDQCIGGALLISTDSLRRFRWTGQPSLHMLRLKAKKNDVLSTNILSLAWSQSGDHTRLISAGAALTVKQGRASYVFRDLSYDEDQIRDLDITTHSRQVATLFFAQDSTTREALTKIQRSPEKIRMDSCFI